MVADVEEYVEVPMKLDPITAKLHSLSQSRIMHGHDTYLYIQVVSRSVSILYLYIATNMLMYT